MDKEPRTRKESKKSDKDKKWGHNNLVTGKGTRQKLALLEKGMEKLKDKEKK